jgi:hypothetical protein
MMTAREGPASESALEVIRDLAGKLGFLRFQLTLVSAP